ncbi:hypothetical protein V1511DRAFT_513388 [Dipodascopsis uninucleata]
MESSRRIGGSRRSPKRKLLASPALRALDENASSPGLESPFKLSPKSVQPKSRSKSLSPRRRDLGGLDIARHSTNLRERITVFVDPDISETSSGQQNKLEDSDEDDENKENIAPPEAESILLGRGSWGNKIPVGRNVLGDLSIEQVTLNCGQHDPDQQNARNGTLHTQINAQSLFLESTSDQRQYRRSRATVNELSFSGALPANTVDTIAGLQQPQMQSLKSPSLAMMQFTPLRRETEERVDELEPDLDKDMSYITPPRPRIRRYQPGDAIGPLLESRACDRWPLSAPGKALKLYDVDELNLGGVKRKIDFHIYED